MSVYHILDEALLKNFPVGTKVRTLRGNKRTGSFTGWVTGHGTWKTYAAVYVRKDGLIPAEVRCLAKNLIRMDRLNPTVGIQAHGPQALVDLANRVGKLEQDVALLKRMRL